MNEQKMERIVKKLFEIFIGVLSLHIQHLDTHLKHDPTSFDFIINTIAQKKSTENIIENMKKQISEPWT